jgi:hypothetical protein
MPRESNELPSPRGHRTAVELREVAARARRLARQILDPQAETMLIGFADEMEARAATLETAAESVGRGEGVAVQWSDPNAGQG